MRFAMTARTIASSRAEGRDISEMTARNVEKVTRYKPNGENELEQMVKKMSKLEFGERNMAANDEARWFVKEEDGAKKGGKRM
jgi:large subunit ribosomal protein L17